MTLYRSTNHHRPLWREDAEAEAAREILAAHVPDKETGLCAQCATPGPCRPANAAANRLTELGRPIPPPEQPKRRRGWRGWFNPDRTHNQATRRHDAPAPTSNPGRHRPPADIPGRHRYRPHHRARTAPLLSHAWRLRLGLPANPAADLRPTWAPS
jgi:hypothetical protein